MLKKITALFVGFHMIASPALSLAAPNIPGFYGKAALPAVSPNTLPQVKLNPDGKKAAVGAVVGDPSGNSLVINQNESRAVIDWTAFNIGAEAAVRFNQGTGKPETDSFKPDSSFAVLNRIHDTNPSQIFGNLQADGKVYLINQNGILFAPGSQVNVSSLVGSTLNLKNADFMKGLLHFRSENYQHADYDPAQAANNLTLALPDPEAAVANHGAMTATTGGSVFLLGPQVENGGTITSPQGKVYLVAVKGAGSGSSADNSEVRIVEYSEPGTKDVRYGDRAVAGAATNLESGRIIAHSGRVGLYGATVRQDGLIRAVTAVKRGGEIYLAASDRVITGAGSLTETPVSDSQEKADQSFLFNSGIVKIGGLATKPDEVSEAVLQPLQHIEHYGAISAPSGEVTLNAVERIFLDSGSSINVAGLWLDRSAEANLLKVQLNSVEMKNDYGQKYGEIKGDTITVDVAVGSSIGDLSGAYLAQEKTAQERSTKGGTVILAAPDLKMPGNDKSYILRDLIVKEGANIDFSGGGIRYASGLLATTKLLSGNKIYDIGSAPQWLTYQSLDSQKVEYRRFGITEEFTGLYYGGGAQLFTYAPARTVGSDAGTLSVAARQIVLDGTLKGSVTRGLLQTATTAYTDNDRRDYNISVARGLEVPNGGTLLIGRDPGETVASDNANKGGLLFDSGVNQITVKATTATLGEFHADTLLDRPGTELSAALLNGAGLSRLGLFSNTSVVTEAGARLNLLPGGSFTATGRRIEHHGELNAAGGSAKFYLRDNITSHPFLKNPETNEIDLLNPDYQGGPSTIPTLYFALGSVVSVKGEAINNSAIGSAGTNRRGLTGGGQITIQDITADGALKGNNLVLSRGALLDVSGGYQIDQKGKVTGGNAGTVDLRAMNLSLAGELRGLALAEKKGGEIKLHTGEIVVGSIGETLPEGAAPDATAPEALQGKLFLAQDRFRDSGFTRIGLTAVNDVTFTAGTSLQASKARLTQPIAGAPGSAFQPSEEMANSAEYLGETSLTATAGAKIYTGLLLDPDAEILPNLTARVDVQSGATLKTAPGGKITLTGPAVRIAGTLDAPGGTISVKATQADLNLSGTVSAAGYLKPDASTVAGVPAGPMPQSAGTVHLEAAKGSIVLAAGSKVDVSGTVASPRLIRGTNGAAVAVTVAGDPGRLNLNYGTELVLNGEIAAGKAEVSGVGGTLTVHKNDANTSSLVVSAADVARYQGSGFDALTFKNSNSLELQGGSRLEVGRSLTLDAPEIRGTASDVTVRAPWVRLVNSSDRTAAPVAAGEADAATLSIAGEWIDMEGSLALTGFGKVSVAAQRDLRLADRIYLETWTGGLETPGDLTLQAARIYPTTATDFTISSGGKVTVLPGQSPDSTPIYSAGGKLTIEAAQGIEHRGVLAVPMGSATLDGGAGRVLLAEGSVIATSAAVPVSYGSFDGTFWTVKDIDQSNKGVQVQGAPDKSITLKGDEVIVKDGAQLDSAGGGSVYTYLYQAGIEGTVNPISGSGRYVILPDNSVQRPGIIDAQTGKTVGAVHLSGVRLDDGTYLKEGTYSLLPEQFAFLPGALVISELGTMVAPGAQPRTKEGYQVVAGHATYLGSGVQSQLQKGYAVRSAADVLKEGNFTVKGEVGQFNEGKKFKAGDGGSLAVNGKTTVMAGSYRADALSGYRQGSLELSGSVITVQELAPELPEGFNFDWEMPDALKGQLQLSAEALSGKEFSALKLGDEQGTSTIIVKSGSELTSRNITLAAKGSVTVESGAKVEGLSENGGSVTMSASEGEVVIEAGAVVGATDSISLDGGDLTLNGELVIDNSDHGSLKLKADEIFFVDNSYTKGNDEHGLLVTEDLWNSFSGHKEIGLTSRSNLTFLRDVDLKVGVREKTVEGVPTLVKSVEGTLTLDAGRFAGSTAVTMEAKKINLVNSGAAADDPEQATAGSLKLKAEEISLSGGSNNGSIVFDGFGTVRLESTKDLTLQGAGALKTGGDLAISAARVTTSFYRDAATPYTAANFIIDATGAIEIANSGGTAGSITTPGGTLSIKGRSITQSGIIEVASGQVELTATGSGADDGIFLADGSAILARGSKMATAKPGQFEYLPGGRIALRSDSGEVNLKSGSLLDVSANGSGDAGAISVSAPTKGVTLEGTLLGKAGQGGRGGSLTLDSDAADLAALNGKLRDGGFTERLSIRSRQGDLVLAAGEVLKGRDVTLTADLGAIELSGKISADGDAIDRNGGRVELNAGSALILEAGSVISARGTGTGAQGGDVALNAAATGKIDGKYALQVRPKEETDALRPGALIDVSGAAKGGSVALRAYRLGDDVNMDSLAPGAVTGASGVSVEAARSYTINGDIDVAKTVVRTGADPPAETSRYDYDAYQFMTKNAADLKDRLFGAAESDPNYHLQAGIELRSEAGNDLTLASTWDLTSWRYLDEPGVLTLRSANDLNIGGHLVDHPTALANLTGAGTDSSWRINLVAGADLTGASRHAVKAATGAGNLVIADNMLVYTENAPLRFASANDTIIGAGLAANYMVNKNIAYNLASYGGGIRGEVGNDLSINGGAIQSALGDIELRVGRDLALSEAAIRTTGEYASGTEVEIGPGAGKRQAAISDYWSYRNGGDISLDVGRDLTGFVNNDTNSNNPGKNNAWDYSYGGGTKYTPKNKQLSASFEGVDSTQGIATMGGGDIEVRTGGALTSQIGAFGKASVVDGKDLGKGDLTITAGGDLKGRFRVMNGVASLSSAGAFGGPGKMDRQVIELADAQLIISALGDIHLGAVINPDNTRDELFFGENEGKWNQTFTENTAMQISSLAGDITFYGKSYFDAYTGSSSGYTPPEQRQRILPASVTMLAAGDLRLQNEFAMAPSQGGNLQLFADGSIDGHYSSDSKAKLFMTDKAPESVYGYQKATELNLYSDEISEKSVVHRGDGIPVVVSAGKDITNIQLYLTKKAEISAGISAGADGVIKGGDIRGLVFSGQNIDPADVTSIRAGGDIRYAFVADVNLLGNVSPEDFGIQLAGPGALMIQAGGNIDLGNSRGIRSTGNALSPGLGGKGADLIVIAGAKNIVDEDGVEHFPMLQLADVADFFNGEGGKADHEDDSLNGLRQAGSDYVDLKSKGETEEAEERLEAVRATLIRPWFDAPADAEGGTPGGTISMTSSQISTLKSKDDIYILAKSVINVGQTAFVDSATMQSTGITTASRGAINIYAGGDVNVNESRVMTFLGGDITMGDITIWSDRGNINAGRGSKSTINAASPTLNDKGELVFAPPAVGSGLRALSYDPDGFEGPQEAPEPGDIYVFAPNGEIDAGEAGIAGGKIILGAVTIGNIGNIDAGSGSIGLPATTDSSVSLGALAGAGSVAENGKMIDQMSTLGSAKEKYEQQANAVDDFMSRWLDVKIISFD